jgi:hypothetical protein
LCFVTVKSSGAAESLGGFRYGRLVAELARVSAVHVCGWGTESLGGFRYGRFFPVAELASVSAG